MRAARDWFAQNFKPASIEEMQQLAPQFSQENAYVRMVTGYWEMVASLITSGVLNQELFFEAGGEMLFVWERMRELVPQMREFMKMPRMYHNLEIVGTAYAKWFDAQGPGAYATFQAMVKGGVSASARQ